MHGGLLRLEEWESRYKAVSAELEQVETKEMEKPVAEKDDEEEDGDEDEGDESQQSEDGDEESMSTPARTPKTPKARYAQHFLKYFPSDA